MGSALDGVKSVLGDIITDHSNIHEALGKKMCVVEESVNTKFNGLVGLTDTMDKFGAGLREAVNASTARVVNVQQLFGALNETHKHEMQALQSRLAMLEGKIQSQGEWLSDFSKRNMALDAKMGTVVQLLQVITQRLNASPTTVLSAASAAVQSDKLSI